MNESDGTKEKNGGGTERPPCHSRKCMATSLLVIYSNYYASRAEENAKPGGESDSRGKLDEKE